MNGLNVMLFIVFGFARGLEVGSAEAGETATKSPTPFFRGARLNFTTSFFRKHSLPKFPYTRGNIKLIT